MFLTFSVVEDAKLMLCCVAGHASSAGGHMCVARDLLTRFTSRARMPYLYWSAVWAFRAVGHRTDFLRCSTLLSLLTTSYCSLFNFGALCPMFLIRQSKRRRVKIG